MARDYPCNIPQPRREEIIDAGQIIEEASFMLHVLLRDNPGPWGYEVTKAIQELERAKRAAHVALAEIGLD